MYSNNVENLARPIVLSGKNAQFAGHDEGAAAWGRIASLIKTVAARLLAVAGSTRLHTAPPRPTPPPPRLEDDRKLKVRNFQSELTVESDVRGTAHVCPPREEEIDFSDTIARLERRAKQAIRRVIIIGILLVVSILMVFYVILISGILTREPISPGTADLDL